MIKNIFVTGIGTDVGKTIISAIICESLKADYFKPIQAGDTAQGDRQAVESLISNTISKVHANAYSLNHAMSPHAAAELDAINIKAQDVKPPETDNSLVIEGAGGLLVPINNTETVLDIIQKNWHVIVVSRHYLGSINHSLLTIKLLQQHGFKVSVIFNGIQNQATETIIQKMTAVDVIGRVNEEEWIDRKMIKKYAQRFHTALLEL